MLRAFILALHHDAGREVCNAHGGVGGVDVLTARTARPVGVHLEIVGLDINVDVLLDRPFIKYFVRAIVLVYI